MMSSSRRAFLLGGSAALAATGCRSRGLFAPRPDLRFGVISDIHVTTPASIAMFVRALNVFKSRGVDAVVVPGDLTDWGLLSSLRYVKQAWDEVFAGTGVVPLFCTGNHDFEGWDYGDMTLEMHVNGYSERERLVNYPGGLKAAWQDVFGEPYAPCRVRSVKGYDFVSAEWGAEKEIVPWMAAHASRFRGSRPFFYFQHMPIAHTTRDGVAHGNPETFEALKAFPNAVAFSGHAHRPFVDEQSIWQGAFTTVSTPSLSYACYPRGHENGERRERNPETRVMPRLTDRRDLRGGQGFLVEVFPDEISIERLDLEEYGVESAPAWLVPLPMSVNNRPFDLARRTADSVAPAFPEGAKLLVDTSNTENRLGHWTIVMDCHFPSACAEAGQRVFDYEIRTVPVDGSPTRSWKFLSPAYARLPRYEPEMQRFWFDAKDVPMEKDYFIEVRAYNCFGKASAPLISGPWHSEPGLDRPDPTVMAK